MDKKIGPSLPPVSFKEPPKKSELSPARQGKTAEKREFEQILERDLQEKSELKISAHAMKRINERKLDIDGSEFMKLKEAISQLKVKGGRDSLVITDKAAYIVDVEKNTVVTAMAKGNLQNNIFTKIDSTVIID